MNNIYHRDISIPVDFVYPSIVVADPLKHQHTRINRSQLGQDFVEWIYSLGLRLREGDAAGEYFYTPANSMVPMHTDKHEIVDVVKMNWMRGGESSTMDWYELIPGKTLSNFNHTNLKTAYAYANPEDVTHVYSAKIGTPSIVNVGRLHSHTTNDEPSHVYCVYIDSPLTNQRLTWNEVSMYFEPFMYD